MCLLRPVQTPGDAQHRPEMGAPGPPDIDCSRKSSGFEIRVGVYLLSIAFTLETSSTRTLVILITKGGSGVVRLIKATLQTGPISAGY